MPTPTALPRTTPLLGALQLIAPFTLPSFAVVATTIYSGALLPDLTPGLRGLLVGFGPLLLHILAPLADGILGERPPPPPPAGAKAPASDNLAARLLPTLSIIAHLTAAAYAYITISTAPLQPGLLVLLALSLATSAATALAASHELVHSRHPVHLGAAATFLTVYWWYPYYRAHHQHHLHVATPVDYSCAGKGESVYSYIGRYVPCSYAEAWQLAAAECERQGKPAFSLHNSTLGALVAQAAVTAAVWLAFGPAALAVHLGSCAVLLLYISLLDYVLHYGLYRPPLAGREGRFAPITQYTSWNSLYAIENALLFNVLLHSDHHLCGNKSYAWLRPDDAVPTFPGPINLLGLMALVPPAWSALMDSRVDDANGRNYRHLNRAAISTSAAPDKAAAMVANEGGG